MSNIYSFFGLPDPNEGIPIDDQIHSSLTECLNAIYMETQMTEFYIDAGKGEVHVEDGQEKPEPVKRYSLYGEEY